MLRTIEYKRRDNKKDDQKDEKKNSKSNGMITDMIILIYFPLFWGNIV